MADNVTTPVPDNTKLAFDEVSLGGETVKVGRNKLGFGEDGEYTEVSTADPLPVSLDFPETQPVSLTAIPLPDGAATAAKQDDIVTAIGNIAAGGDASAANQTTMIGHLDGIETALGGTLTVSGPLTDTELRATPVPVDVDFPTTQQVSGDVGISGSVAVTGPLTDAELRASAVPVDVSFPETQTVDGAVTVTNTVDVAADSLPLPTGAATADKQDEAKASLDKLASAKSWFDITPADSNLSTVPDAIYVGGDGDLVLRGDDGEDATFAVVAGQVLPFAPAQVRAATTATGLVGLLA